jgi:alcohol dehydrogenase (cytochrome c)
MRFNFFVIGTDGKAVPISDSVPDGVGKGTITTIDMSTGNIKWQHSTDYPTWVSQLVTNGLVFSGHITTTRKPYHFSRL